MKPDKVLSDKAVKALKSLDPDNIDVAHSDADDTLCRLLLDLGYQEVVEAFNALEKWYN